MTNISEKGHYWCQRRRYGHSCMACMFFELEVENYVPSFRIRISVPLPVTTGPRQHKLSHLTHSANSKSPQPRDVLQKEASKISQTLGVSMEQRLPLK
jgi:hypothetical protein